MQLAGYWSVDVTPTGSFNATKHKHEHEFNTTAYIINFPGMTIPFITSGMQYLTIH